MNIFAKNVIINAAICLISINIVPLGNTKSLQSLQMSILKPRVDKRTCINAVNVIKVTLRGWVYGNIPRSASP
jgi:hypothetical protein